jgi:hypothetical protein
VKRSKNIRLFLLGGISGMALSGCDQKPALNTANYYTNNFYVPGAGYYHAPYRSWYPLPYNYFDAQKQQYYYGGQWALRPDSSITNISAPLLASVNSAENSRTDVSRGGFGSSAGWHSWNSWDGYSGFHS